MLFNFGRFRRRNYRRLAERKNRLGTQILDGIYRFFLKKKEYGTIFYRIKKDASKQNAIETPKIIEIWIVPSQQQTSMRTQWVLRINWELPSEFHWIAAMGPTANTHMCAVQCTMPMKLKKNIFLRLSIMLRISWKYLFRWNGIRILNAHVCL